MQSNFDRNNQIAQRIAIENEETTTDDENFTDELYSISPSALKNRET